MNLIPIDFNAPSNLPAHLVSKSKVTDMLGGGLGSSRARISLKNSRFHLVNGGTVVATRQEPYLDVIIVGAGDAVGRQYYANAFDNNAKGAPPDCYSVDGVTPAAGAKLKQCGSCSQCPQNQSGSRVVGNKASRACAFFKRLAVVLYGDPEMKVYQLDVKAMSLFGTGIAAQNLFTLQEYNKMFQQRHLRVDAIVTRLSFDLNATVAKLFFTPVGYLQEADLNAMLNRPGRQEEIDEVLAVDAADFVDGPVAGVQETYAQPVQAAPVYTPPPAPAFVPRPAPVFAPAPAPAPVQAAPVYAQPTATPPAYHPPKPEQPQPAVFSAPVAAPVQAAAPAEAEIGDVSDLDAYLKNSGLVISE